jgi:adenylosuccinate lyase
LNEKWEVLAEPIQTMLRKYGVPDAYDTLKALTRGKNISREDILKFAESLDMLSEEDRQTLVNMTPASYIGKAAALATLEL